MIPIKKSAWYKNIPFFIIMLFLIVCPYNRLDAGNCENNSDYRDSLQMETTAKSGLRLREDSSLDSKVITTIPFRSTVYVGYVDNRIVTIGGVRGYWVRVCWKHTSFNGWVFSGFLKKKRDVNYTIPDMYTLSLLGPLAKGETALFVFGGNDNPEGLEQNENSLTISFIQPPAATIIYHLSGNTQKIAFSSDNCTEVKITVANITSRRKSEGIQIDVYGRILSIKKTICR